MNDVDRWIYFDGPEPERLRPLLSALREVAMPRPTPEDKARMMAAFFEKLDARLGRVTEGRAEEARGSAPPAAPTPSGDARSVDEVQALAKGEASLGFEAWAELSLRFIGKSQQEKLQALGARKLTLQQWAAIDDDYLRMLYADLRAGRTDRQAVYAAKCNEEMAHRAKASEAPKEDAPAPLPAVVGAPGALTSTEEQVDMPAAVWAALGKLPFKPAPPESPAPGQGTVKTMPVPVVSSSLGETLPLGSDAMQKAVAAVPFIGSTAGAGVVAARGSRCHAGAVDRDVAQVRRAERGVTPCARRALAARAGGEAGVARGDGRGRRDVRALAPGAFGVGRLAPAPPSAARRTTRAWHDRRSSTEASGSSLIARSRLADI